MRPALDQRLGLETVDLARERGFVELDQGREPGGVQTGVLVNAHERGELHRGEVVGGELLGGNGYRQLESPAKEVAGRLAQVLDGEDGHGRSVERDG